MTLPLLTPLNTPREDAANVLVLGHTCRACACEHRCYLPLGAFTDWHTHPCGVLVTWAAIFQGGGPACPVGGASTHRLVPP